MYKRQIEKDIEEYLNSSKPKILFIWGPRRSGKTTLLEKVASDKKSRIFNFDYVTDREFFVNRREIVAKLVKENSLILIDEVQNYPESTVALKILADNYDIKIIATGSSELRKKSQNFDTLAGRFDEIFCLPLSVFELSENDMPKDYELSQYYKMKALEGMVFGFYPEVLTAKKEEDKVKLLEKILNTYVLKDAIDIYELKNAKLAKDILVKLALQIGQEVSFNEIARSLGANVGTVSNYIEVFVKNYIIFPLPSYKTNLRRAVSEKGKYFFLDIGIRNALVKDFREIDLRPDKGGVFENFVISEVYKKNLIDLRKVNMYFFRDYSGREVDLVLEDYKKNYSCLEIKFSDGSFNKNIFPLAHKGSVVNLENYFTRIPRS
ncbi:MAG: ATP-binding protein [Patescibacteria group bacterium]